LLRPDERELASLLVRKGEGDEAILARLLDDLEAAALKRRSPRGITAEAGVPYLGHTSTSLARTQFEFYASRCSHRK
jgi:hypothetical protein